MATLTMENGDLELGEVDMIQRRVQSVLNFVENEENHPNRFSPFICVAPRILRDLSPSSFDPQVVSIGPLHREDENLKAFEGRKASYMSKLMSRIDSSREQIMDSCMQKVYASMKKVKACYVWRKKTYSDDEIAQMMVVDACFILEFVYQWNLVCAGVEDDDLLGGTLLVGTIWSDLILLENQIPFFILAEIHQCTVLKFHPSTSLIELFGPFVSSYTIFTTPIKIDYTSIDTATHHILSLLHQCYKPQDNIIRTKIKTTKIPSVVDLDRAGVNFKPNQDPKWVMGMQVELNHRLPWVFASTLRMPVLHLHDQSELLFRNLIAYEQLGLRTSNYISSYALAMDFLVNTQQDVTKLVDSGVIINFMGSKEEAVDMINNICKQLPPVNFFYTKEMDTLSKYCNSYWPKNIARLRRTYFNSPWNIIALLAGIILFALTMVQTIFTIKSSGSNK